LGGVYDGLSTRLAHQAGFEVMFVGGFSVAATLLGEPDFGYLTQTEIADTARRVRGPLDLIVSGHTHTRVNTVVNEIPIVQAASSGTA